MKKLLLFAVFAVALSGITMAQATPKQAKTPAKKEATTPAATPAKTETAKKDGGTHHHHKKHAKPKQAK